MLMDNDGKRPIVDQTVGYWLCGDDFVSTEGLAAKHLGKIGFLRDWPAVYSSSKALKSLIGKKGKCAGKKVAVVPAASPEELGQLAGVTLQRLQSFANAVQVEKATGMATVRGWAVFEHLDLPSSSAFVAERYWWNVSKAGRWVDFTPRPVMWPELILAEAAGDASKEQSKLSSDEVEIAELFLCERFGLTRQEIDDAKVEDAKVEGAAQVEGGKPSASSTARPAERVSRTPDHLLEIVKALQRREAKAVCELSEKIKKDEELAPQVAYDIADPLVRMLGEHSRCSAALDLLLVLTDAGVGQKSDEVRACCIEAGVVPVLVGILGKKDGSAAEYMEQAAATLGNLCHESPESQDMLAKAGVLEHLVRLLSGEEGPAQEAAYTIWNLSVNHKPNCEAFTSLGAVPRLVQLLHSASDVAQENAAGALMHLTMCEASRKAIVEANAIPRLCELLQPCYELEVRGQAAGALLNLASDSSENARVIAKTGSLGLLVSLAKTDKVEIGQEYAAGALMNLIRGDAELAGQAAREGAVQVLASLLAKPHGHSEALGALANLASGSAERQALVYKSQVTRRSVAMLSNPDVEVRRSATALLMNMAPHKKIKDRIVEAGALKPLAACLQDADNQVQERAAGAIANLFNDHSANVVAGFKQAPEMIPFLIAILKSASATSDAKRQAAHGLAMLAAEDGPCDAVWSAGPGPGFLALLKDGIGEAALGIMNLAWRCQDVREEMAKGGAVEDLIAMLKQADVVANEYAAGALMNLTAGSPDIAAKAGAAAPLLARLLEAESVQAAEWSAGALANIAKAGLEALGPKTSMDVVDRLAALLPRATIGGRPLVVLAFISLLEAGGNEVTQSVRKVFCSAEGKDKLKELRAKGNEELRDHTETLIQKLGEGFVL